jgi:hypothetical protein
MRRTAVALVAILAAALTLMAAPADARTSAAPAIRAHASDRQLPRRPISITWNQVRARHDAVRVAIHGRTVAWAGRSVILQRKRNGIWHIAARGHTTLRSKFRFVGWFHRGVYRYRLRVPRGNGYALSVSHVVAFRVS